MLSRALILATVAFVFGCLTAIPASAQNLEAGKSPSQIFSSTCSLCHKSPRGLLKGASPGSLPGFLRQHYTTSSDMASAMSAYVLSNGAANPAVGGGNLTRQGQEAKSAPKPAVTTSEPKPESKPEPKPERAARGTKPAREASKPDVDGLEDIPGVSQEATSPVEDDKPMTPAAKRKAAREAAREAAKQKAAKGKPVTSERPKAEAKHEAPKEEPKAEGAKPDAAKPDTAKTEPAKTEPAKTEAAKSDAAKEEGTRPDPVPAVTPAPKEPEKQPEKGPDTAASAAPSKPVDDNPNRPLTIDVGPATTPPPAAVLSGPPAGPPIPPISQ